MFTTANHMSAGLARRFIIAVIGRWHRSRESMPVPSKSASDFDEFQVIIQVFIKVGGTDFDGTFSHLQRTMVTKRRVSGSS